MHHSGEFCGAGGRGGNHCSVPSNLLSGKCNSVMFIYGFVVKMSFIFGDECNSVMFVYGCGKHEFDFR